MHTNTLWKTCLKKSPPVARWHRRRRFHLHSVFFPGLRTPAVWLDEPRWHAQESLEWHTAHSDITRCCSVTASLGDIEKKRKKFTTTLGCIHTLAFSAHKTFVKCPKKILKNTQQESYRLCQDEETPFWWKLSRVFTWELEATSGWRDSFLVEIV